MTTIDAIKMLLDEIKTNGIEEITVLHFQTDKRSYYIENNDGNMNIEITDKTKKEN